MAVLIGNISLIADANQLKTIQKLHMKKLNA